MSMMLYALSIITLISLSVRAQEEHELTQITEQAVPEEYFLDTMSEPKGGNWYLKRKYSDQAKATYQKLTQVIAHIDQSQEYFLKAQGDLNQELNSFYNEIGYKAGQLDALIESIRLDLIKEKKRHGAEMGEITEEERVLLEELDQQEEQLDHFAQSAELIKQGQQNIQAALAQVLEVINLGNNYIDKALKGIQDIDETVDDEKAHVIAEQINAYLEHAQSLDTNYLNGDLKNYLDTTISQIRAQMQAVKTRLKQFQEQGVILQASVAEQQEAEHERMARKAKKLAAQKKAEEQKSLSEKIISFFASFWSSMKQFFLNIFNAIFGQKS